MTSMTPSNEGNSISYGHPTRTRLRAEALQRAGTVTLFLTNQWDTDLLVELDTQLFVNFFPTRVWRDGRDQEAILRVLASPGLLLNICSQQFTRCFLAQRSWILLKH